MTEEEMRGEIENAVLKALLIVLASIAAGALLVVVVSALLGGVR